MGTRSRLLSFVENETMLGERNKKEAYTTEQDRYVENETGTCKTKQAWENGTRVGKTRHWLEKRDRCTPRPGHEPSGQTPSLGAHLHCIAGVRGL